MQNPIKTFVIDLFCGAGGTSTAIFNSKTNIEVVACINHDKNAIISHSENYPECLHFIEDIRTIELSPLIDLVKNLKYKHPNCKIALWASLECTNFSKAKCGPKDCDSRSLADDMFRYLDAIDFDFFWVENVEEFLDWGPLDGNNMPVKSLKGTFYNEWLFKLRFEYFSDSYYKDKLVSSDFGGYTIRKRLFLQFAKNPEEIGIPKQTHSKNGVFLNKWKPVREIIDTTNYGKSIFKRKKPLVWKTHRNIFKGLEKHYSSDGVSFGFTYYGNSSTIDLSGSCPTLTTKDRIAIVSTKAHCINQAYGNPTAKSLNEPFYTLTGSAKGELISSKKLGFMINPQYGGSSKSVDDPCCTLIARQDKAPLGVSFVDSIDFLNVVEKQKLCVNYMVDEPISFRNGVLTYIYSSLDDEYLTKIKDFMYDNNLIDILHRTLTIEEMLQIQGFPKNYILFGTQTQQKKYIGNSVEINVGIALIKSIDEAIQSNYLNKYKVA